MNIAKSEFEIIFEDKKYYLLVDKKKLLTPNNHFICHENLKLLESIQFELECVDKLDPTIISTYTLLSRQIDWFDNLNHHIEIEKFRSAILSDGVLSDCAGPEKLDQYLKWGTLFEHLDKISMKYPSLIQALDLEELEEWIANSEEDLKISIGKLVSHFYDEYNLLSSYQKTVVLSAYQLHKSIIYGIFLATKQCSELEYTAAILASQCLIPNVFGDVVKKEYKEAFDEVKNDALILTNYLQHASNPGISIQSIIKQNISNWGFLPDKAKYPLLEAIRQSINPEIQDYSSAVVLFGKSLEICLKNLVFEKFKLESGITFQEDNETRIFIENNNQIENLARFIAKPPHRIELGSMLFVLEKQGGRTANSNELLKRFFDYLSTILKNNKITSREWIADAKIVLEARNKAAHSERFNLEELKKVEKLTYELLAAF